MSIADNWVIVLRSARLADTPSDTAPLSCLCIEKYSRSTFKIQASWNYDSQRTASTDISPHKNAKNDGPQETAAYEVEVDVLDHGVFRWGDPPGREGKTPQSY